MERVTRVILRVTVILAVVTEMLELVLAVLGRMGGVC